METEINGKKPKLPNALAIASNGDIYWSDSSTEFYLEDGVLDMFADGSGRLIHYNVKTKSNTVLIDNLLFANGLALSSDEEFVLVVESGRSCVHRYYLKGPKKGTRDVFIDGLPGIPDNINSDGQGGFFFPLIIPRDDYTPVPSQVLGPFPLFRKLVARMIGLGELGFTLANRIYRMELFERAIHLIGHFSVVSYILPGRVTIVHVSKTGEIIEALHGNNKKAIGISEAYIFNGELYLGSPFNDFIPRIALRKVGLEHLVKKPAIQEKPTTTAKPPPPKASTPTPTKAPPTTTTTTKAPTTTKRTTTAAPTTTPQAARTVPVTEAPTKTTPSTTAMPPTTAQTTAKPSPTTKAPTTTQQKTTTTAQPVTKPPPQQEQPKKAAEPTKPTSTTPKPSVTQNTSPKPVQPKPVDKPARAQTKAAEGKKQESKPEAMQAKPNQQQKATTTSQNDIPK
ncbi:hypothetical protein AMK59_647 [Oryctes borbonicus]|uniref:Strictosidine synthase conserved region domain-containing protein n=1 Tax=Oryctes borbonicus TaxID=1629725 RepID=A0A0T6BGX9_9SCAR|nr:hypothetical protein AMK59_647 [Oryctes borbonicus]